MHYFHQEPPQGFTRMGVYGTLKRGFRANDMLMANSVFVSHAITQQTAVLFHGGFPALRFSEDVHDDMRQHLKHVLVEVYDVPDEDVPDVDGYEGHPNLFIRQEHTFLLVEPDEEDESQLLVVPEVNVFNLYKFNQPVNGRNRSATTTLIGLDGMAFEAYNWSR